MNHHSFWLGWLVLVLGIARLSADAESLLDREALGPLKLGQTAADVTRLLGAPESRGKETEWAALGEWVQEWRFPRQGLKLHLAAAEKGGAQTVLMVTATAPCQFATAHGIKMGSSVAEVTRAYREVEDKEHSRPGESFVAGSIYGGVIFTFKEGKVAEIFLGAAAE